MKVAVIIPTYNRPDLLREALESVRGQTAPPTQTIVVDDGSTTPVEETLPTDAYPDVLFLRQENAGPGAARNRGWRAVAPDVEAVLFLDDDDRLRPDALARLTDALRSVPSAPLVYGRPAYIAADGSPLPQTWGWDDFTDSPYEPLMRRNFIGTPGCALVRRSALSDPAPWDENRTISLTADWDFWLRLAEENAPFARVADPERPVLEYRVTADSLSRNVVRLREQERVVCRKHRDRAPVGSVGRAVWDAIIAERERRQAEAEREGVAPEEAQLTPRHRFLRRAIERTGVASLYRRIPLSARLRLRTLLGVDRQAG